MTQLRVVVLLLSWGLVTTACGGGADRAEPSSGGSTQPTATEVTPSSLADDREPVVIDTDVSVEGAMAILYLLQEPQIRVEAITISGTGLVSCRAGVEQALALAALAEAADMPVACGAERPLSGDNRFPSDFRTRAESLSGVRLPPGGAPSELSAPDLLASVIDSSEVPVVIYADGPPTNLALLFEQHPDVVDNVARINMMGGAVDVGGNTFDNPDAEWNVWIDPVATDRVFRSGVPITLVPLDATNEVPLTPLHVAALEPHQATPIAQTVFQLVQGLPGLGQGFTSMWDQLNAAVLVDESLVTLEPRSLSVVTEGGGDAVGSLVSDPDGVEVLVAVDADRAGFERRFLTTLLGEPFEPVQTSPDFSVTFDGETWTHDIPASWPRGPVVVELTNSSDQAAGVVFGWLLGDATLEDVDAWTSIEQPPFLEVAGLAGADPNNSDVTVIELTEPGTNVVIAFTLAPDLATRIATLQVG